jgi:hypothetical protein
MALDTGCIRCRTIRRFLLAFALGVAVAWQINGAPPLGLQENTWRGIIMVIMVFAGMTVFARMRQIRRHFQR